MSKGAAAGGRAPVVKPFVRIGSWVGGDRDGNPFVTASVTRKAAAIASEHVLRGLEATTLRIGRTLTPSIMAVPVRHQFLQVLPELRFKRALLHQRFQ